VDSSNIELRVNHTLAGQEDVVQAFKDKRDLYCEFASDRFGRPITKADAIERFIGKQAHLSLGYGCGHKKYRNTVRVKSRELIDAGKIDSELIISVEEADETVNSWRRKYNRVVYNNWKAADQALEAMAYGSSACVGVGQRVTTFTEQGLCGFVLPDGHKIRYHDLQRDEQGWSYFTNRGRKRIYGAAAVENICQSIAGHILGGQWLAVQEFFRQEFPRWHVVLQVHDELAAVGPEDDAQAVADNMTRIFSTAPSWWPDLCLAAEAGIGRRYGLAK
jgi:DNA polymerase